MHCMQPQVERLRVRCLKLKSCSDDYSLKSDSSVTFVNGQLPTGILEHVQLHTNYVICCNYQNGTPLSTLDPNSIHWNFTMRKDVDLITKATNATFICLSNTRKHQGCTWPKRHWSDLRSFTCAVSQFADETSWPFPVDLMPSVLLFLSKVNGTATV